MNAKTSSHSIVTRRFITFLSCAVIAATAGLCLLAIVLYKHEKAIHALVAYAAEAVMVAERSETITSQQVATFELSPGQSRAFFDDSVFVGLTLLYPSFISVVVDGQLQDLRVGQSAKYKFENAKCAVTLTKLSLDEQRASFANRCEQREQLTPQSQPHYRAASLQPSRK
jgi:hypothetical protein